MASLAELVEAPVDWLSSLPHSSDVKRASEIIGMEATDDVIERRLLGLLDAALWFAAADEAVSNRQSRRRSTEP